MNELTPRSNGSSSLGPVVGFALGALVGGVLGVLFAPSSGEKTRRRLSDAAGKLGRDTREGFEDTRDRVAGAAEEIGADVKSAIEAGRDAFRQDGSTHEGRPVSRVAQLLSPTPRTP
jgi:gas vesicle protein